MIDQYLQNGFSRVEGFCPVSALVILNHMDKIIVAPEKRAMEIGVHHGQFFIGMNQFANEQSYAIDVFDQQEFNIDRSGNGNLQKFITNLTTYDHRNHGKNVKIIQSDSLNERIFENIEPCSYISVDGGHTPAHVMNDMIMVQKCMAHHGLIIVDDYFNHWWPTVTEGIVKFLMTTPKIVPFCTSPNKMWFCNLSYRDQYIKHVATIENYGQTPTAFFGYPIIDVWEK
jgi:hypothetical protein